MKNNNQNTFKLRVKNADTLQSMHELFDTGSFEFMNDLLNAALDIGIQKLYLEFGKRKNLSTYSVPENDSSKLNDIMARIKKIELTFDDYFVLLNVLEAICTTTLNLKIAELKKEPAEPMLIESGFYADLPKFLQDIKQQVIARLDKR